MTTGAQPLQFAVWGVREYASTLCSILTGRVRTGPNVVKLQHEFEAIYEQSMVLPVNSGRTALRLALEVFAARRPGPRRVLMPEYLCPSAVEVVRDLGLQPWPVKVGPDLNLDPDGLTFNDDVLAVVAAHMYACPAAIGEIERRCHAAGVFLIDDAAQVVGVRSDGRMLGSFGDAGVVSFAQSKTIVTGIRGSGGLLLINNSDLQADLLRSHAKLAPAHNRLSSFFIFLVEYLLASHLGMASYYFTRISHTILPSARKSPYTPALMSNLEAGIAIAQLQRLQQILTARTRVAELYAVALKEISSVKMPQYAAGRFLSRCFVEFPEQQMASMVRRGLLDRKISTRKAYPQWSVSGGCTDGGVLGDRLVELPSRSDMTEAEVVKVAIIIRELLAIFSFGRIPH